jgi:Methyltransferase domain
MEKTLVAYILSQDLFVPFQRTLAIQWQFAKALEGTTILLVTDIPAYSFRLPNIVVPQLGAGNSFRFAVGLNGALNYAHDRGFDWAILLDSDSLVISPATVLPPTGFARTEICRLKAREVPSATMEFRWEKAGHFILSREVFGKHRFFENFRGHGYDYEDLSRELTEAGIHQSSCSARTVHLWHPPRPLWRLESDEELLFRRKPKGIALMAPLNTLHLHQSLASLARVKGIEEYKLFIGIDQDCSEIEAICAAIDFTEREIIINSSGDSNIHNRRLIQFAFDQGCGLVIVLGAGDVLAPDALTLCNWYNRWPGRNRFLLMDLLPHEPSSAIPCQMKPSKSSCSTSWCISKHSFEKWLRAGWMCDSRKVEMSISERLLQKPLLRTLVPTLSQATNITSNALPAITYLDEEIVSSKPPECAYVFIDDVPTCYEEIHDYVHEIPGWLSPAEARWLFDTTRSLPEGAAVLEIGSYKGRSSAALGFGCIGSKKMVYCVDTWNGNNIDFFEKGYFDAWNYHMTLNCLLQFVDHLDGDSKDILPKLLQKEKRFLLTFIDGSHQFETVKMDFEAAYKLTVPGGWIAMHDVGGSWPGPDRVWRELASKMLNECNQVHKLAFGRKSPESVYQF